MSIYGRPGAVYIDLPGDMLRDSIPEEEINFGPKVPQPPKCVPVSQDLERAAKLLRNSARPLVIIGKGAGYSGAEKQMRGFIEVYFIIALYFSHT